MKNKKRNRCWCGPQSSLFEVSQLFDDWWGQDPSGGWCTAGLEVCQRSVPPQLDSCSFLIVPTGPWCQNAQAKMRNWSVSRNAFFWNYHQKTRWRRPCAAQSCRRQVGTGTLVGRKTGTAQSQARSNTAGGTHCQIVMTWGVKCWVLMKDNRFHWLQDSLNHCECHSHGGLLVIKKRKSLKGMTHYCITQPSLEMYLPWSALRNDGSLFVLYRSSPYDFLLIMLVLLWTSQSATLLSADTTSLGVVTVSVKGSLRGCR